VRTLAAAFVVGALVAGCRPDEPVRRYAAPKDSTWRMVAAVVPGPDSTWFFKVVGPSARLESERASVGAFAAGLRVEGGSLKWTLPAGWTEEAGKGDRVATLRFGKSEPRLELAVTRLEGEAGGVLANVNRWRRQMGKDPVAESDLPTTTSTIDAGGLRVTMVELESLRKPAPAPMMDGAARAEREGPSLEQIRAMFSYELPSGWRDNPTPGGGRILEFQAGEGATVSLSILGGDAGGLLSNVNRWRVQAGLGPVDEEAAQRLVRGFGLMGQDGHFVELPGREKSIHCAFSLGPPFSMFVKLEGAPAAVNGQKSAFEIFARSLRFNRKHG
jgi:hypothetical protein